MFDWTITLGDLVQAVATVLAVMIPFVVAFGEYRRNRATQRKAEIQFIFESFDFDSWDIYYEITAGIFEPKEGFPDSTDEINQQLDSYLYCLDTIALVLRSGKGSSEDLGVLRFDIIQFYRNPHIQKYIGWLSEFYEESGMDTRKLRPYDSFLKHGEQLTREYSKQI